MNWPKKLFELFAHLLGRRPALLLFLTILWAVVFMYGLIRTLLVGNGVPLFGWEPNNAADFMKILYVLVICLLIYRVFYAQKILDQSILEMFQVEKPAIGLNLANRLPGSFWSRLLAILKIAPHSILALTTSLMVASILLKINYELLSNNDPNTFSGQVFVNMPWVMALLVATVLIFNDHHVLEKLKENYIRNRLYEIQNLQEISAVFQQTLTPMEYQVLQYKFQQELRNKEVASQLQISESTVKTHVNNINKKWEQFAATRAIQVPLRAIFRK